MEDAMYLEMSMASNRNAGTAQVSLSVAYLHIRGAHQDGNFLANTILSMSDIDLHGPLSKKWRSRQAVRVGQCMKSLVRWQLSCNFSLSGSPSRSENRSRPRREPKQNQSINFQDRANPRAKGEIATACMALPDTLPVMQGERHGPVKRKGQDPLASTGAGGYEALAAGRAQLGPQVELLPTPRRAARCIPQDPGMACPSNLSVDASACMMDLQVLLERVFH